MKREAAVCQVRGAGDSAKLADPHAVIASEAKQSRTARRLWIASALRASQ
jgi:hypothetical protein